MDRIKLTFIVATFLTLNGFAQTTCKTLHHSKLQNLSSNNTSSYVIIDGENHTEFMQNEKFYIKSKLKWIDDCNYEMTMLEKNDPDFPFGPGEKMIVKIDKIEGDFVFLTGTVRNQSFKSKYKIVN
jgi:hypothetical protein